MKRTHLMYTFTPFSAGGKYLGDHSSMIQVFDRKKVTCKNCLKKLGEYKANEKKDRIREVPHGTKESKRID